jgi:hypothetical protein
MWVHIDGSFEEDLKFINDNLIRAVALVEDWNQTFKLIRYECINSYEIIP